MSRLRLGGRSLPVLICCAVLAAACSAPAAGSASRTEAAAPLPATQPYVVMTGPATGWAVWPSGGAWVLLHTSDGFGHLDNRTPIGVPTDGGLVGAFAGDRAAVAVGPVERLVRSPLLTATATLPWAPAELPGGVTGSRSAVALTGTGVTAVTSAAGGTLTLQSGTGWRTAVDARGLPGSRDLRLDGVTWADDSVGWLTGHGAAGGAVAFRTTDSGATWTAVRAPSAGTVAALAPCGGGTTWFMPVLDSTGSVRMLRTSDRGDTWQAGRGLRTAVGETAWGCSGPDVWMVAGSAHGDAVFASADGGGSWTDEGPAPAHLTSLSPTGGGRGFATSGGHSPVLWRVGDDGARFTRIALPDWVAALGAKAGDD